MQREVFSGFKVVKRTTRSQARVNDVVIVSGGRVAGSCGAPYFNSDGKVIAFNFESIDDSETGSADRSQQRVCIVSFARIQRLV